MALHLRKIVNIFLIICLLGAGVLTAMPSLHTHEHHKLCLNQHKHQCPDQDKDDDCIICRTLSHFVIDQPPVLTTITLVQIPILYTVSLYQKPFLVSDRSSLIPRAPPFAF